MTGTVKPPILPLEIAGVSMHHVVRQPVSGTIVERLPVADDGLEIVLYCSEDGFYEWRMLMPEKPVPLRSITITRAEGPSHLCERPEVFTKSIVKGDGKPDSYWKDDWECSGFINANSGMLRWGSSAPKPGRGYDKCDFAVEWEDGTKYEGRFDLQHGGTDAGETFSDSFKSRVRFYAGLAPTPAHFRSREQYLEMVESQPEFKALCRHILAHCEL